MHYGWFKRFFAGCFAIVLWASLWGSICAKGKNEYQIFEKDGVSYAVIIDRDETYQASVEGLYPAGEGAGYAGGITTAAIDGVKVFESIISKYTSNF